MKNCRSKLTNFLFIISSILCTSTYGAEYGRLIVPASSADPSSQAVILAEGETFTVLAISALNPDSSSYNSVSRMPFKLELFYDSSDYDNTEKMITFFDLALAGLYTFNYPNTAYGSAITSSELSRTYVGPCKIRITKTVSNEDCYLAYKIIRKPSPSVSTEE